VGINRAIGRLSGFFVACFVVLGLRVVWLQAIAGPSIAKDPHNPRLSFLERYRGDILARDGTPLAHSTAHGRAYPYGRAIAHAVGYESARYGTAGLERAFDRELSPAPASVDPISQLVALLSGSRTLAPTRGADVITTIDVATQETLYNELSAYPRAAGVVLDPRSGEVLAIASVPSFDPQQIDAGFADLKRNGASPLLDRAIDGLYPPGSTFKIFTASAALDSGVVTPEDTFDDPGALAVGTFTVHDNEGEATGTQDLAGAFALSSNVDFAQIALRLGVARWFEYASRWGLGRETYFTLPAQTDHLPERSSVTPGVLAQLGFGQADLLVTPLRMALIGSTVAVGGVEPQPYLVRAVRVGRGARSIAPKGTLAQPISSDTAAQVRDLMVGVVERGTGTAAALPDVQVAGKTGTATNPAGRSHAWFVAFAPADAPRVAVAVVVENAGYGGVVAAPIARRVLSVALGRISS
jgi:peptidoglycan glycosyltransferase